ncbi:unnamed protein product [Amoebophrya sp. A120]|nr:unnamed protein product [Amoebophrya sp. A120]|eukprot:GSA120T00011973001.1
MKARTTCEWTATPAASPNAAENNVEGECGLKKPGQVNAKIWEVLAKTPDQFCTNLDTEEKCRNEDNNPAFKPKTGVCYWDAANFAGPKCNYAMDETADTGEKLCGVITEEADCVSTPEYIEKNGGRCTWREDDVDAVAGELELPHVDSSRTTGHCFFTDLKLEVARGALYCTVTGSDLEALTEGADGQAEGASEQSKDNHLPLPTCRNSRSCANARKTRTKLELPFLPRVENYAPCRKWKMGKKPAVSSPKRQPWCTGRALLRSMR